MNTSEISIEGLANLPYEAVVELYYKNNGEYCSYSSKTSILVINSAITNIDYNYDMQTTTATREIELNQNMLNPENMIVEFTTTGGEEVEIDLNSYDTINFATGSVEVSLDGDSIYVRITSNDYAETSGTMIINQGNDELGYVDITYTI